MTEAEYKEHRHAEQRRAEDKAMMKEVVKETLREWLDEKFTQFGKWSFYGLVAMFLAGIVWIFMLQNGWHK